MAVGPEGERLEPSAELRAITARLFDALARSDIDAALARFSMMKGLTVWGIDEGEFIDDPDLLVRYVRLEFEEGHVDTSEFGPLRIDAWVEGRVGWSLTHSTVDFGSGPREFRSTFVFHLEHDEWKIIHEHWSLATPEATYGWPAGRTLALILKAAEHERPDLTGSTSDTGTTTLVFTDIQGSTGLNASYGDRGWFEVLRVHNKIVADATANHGGTIVKNQGDGFMLAFPSARRALACSQEIQRGIGETFNDPGSPIRVRIGVHTGEVVSEADDFFGHAVNYAARVASTATGGETLVSTLVHDLVQPTGGFTFEQPRDVELKGIDGPVRVYALA